jgi:hypothetical protein
VTEEESERERGGSTGVEAVLQCPRLGEDLKINDVEDMRPRVRPDMSPENREHD